MEMLLDIKARAADLEVSCHQYKFLMTNVECSQIPFMEELMSEIRFIIKCSGNTKTVTRKKANSREESLEHESRSATCSPNRELTTADIYGFRPSLRNLDKLDLMPDVEIVEDV